MTSTVRAKHLYGVCYSATTLSVTGPCDSLAFKITMNEFDVKDGTSMTPEHHQLQASAEAQKQVSQLWSFIHTLQVLASFLCGFQDTSNVVFCDNLPRPHTRSVRPSVRPGTVQQRLDLLGGASYHSPSSSLRYSLARQKSSWNLATTILISMRCCLKLSTTFPALFTW